jgi:cytochrome c-type biogenesis protein CcmH/NrfG
MLLGGVSVDDRLVRELAAILERPLGRRLEQALVFRAKIVALTREEKEAILATLERAPGELEEVRRLLLADDSWREGRGRLA